MGDTLDKSQSPADSAQPRPYDFRRPTVALTASTAVDALPGDFAQKLATMLSEHLRVPLTVETLPAERMRYDEFLLSLERITCLAILRVDPSAAQILLDIPLPLIYPMIDRALGGTSDSPTPVPQRALTRIEQGLALQIVERAAGLLADTFSGRAPIAVREECLESDSTELRIMPADEVVTIFRFDVSLSGSRGVMSLCLPEPVMQQLPGGAAPAGDGVEEGDAPMRGVNQNILNAAVELRALLAETKLRLSDVLTLQVGDVITTDHPADQDIAVEIEGKEKLHGQLGHLRGVRAVQITRPPESNDQDSGPTGARQ